jgi:hypothetical protein
MEMSISPRAIQGFYPTAQHGDKMNKEGTMLKRQIARRWLAAKLITDYFPKP